MSQLPKYAFFDLDHTITRRDTGAALIGYLIRRRPGYLLRILFAPLLVLGWKLGLYPLFRLKQYFFSFLRGRTQQEIEHLSRAFCDRVFPGICKPRALEHLDKLRREGYIIVLASASPEFYVRFFADKLGIPLWAASRFELQNGRYTGRMLGADCRGMEKVERICALLDLDHYDRNASLAYSDSRADLPMLSLAGTACLVSKKHWHLRPVSSGTDTNNQ